MSRRCKCCVAVLNGHAPVLWDLSDRLLTLCKRDGALHCVAMSRSHNGNRNTLRYLSTGFIHMMWQYSWICKIVFGNNCMFIILIPGIVLLTSQTRSNALSLSQSDLKKVDTKIQFHECRLYNLIVSLKAPCKNLSCFIISVKLLFC